MPTYVCRVGMGDGAIVTRAIDAPDESALKAEVARLGARLFSVKARRRRGDRRRGRRHALFGGFLSGLLPRRGRPVKTGRVPRLQPGARRAPEGRPPDRERLRHPPRTPGESAFQGDPEGRSRPARLGGRALGCLPLARRRVPEALRDLPQGRRALGRDREGAPPLSRLPEDPRRDPAQGDGSPRLSGGPHRPFHRARHHPDDVRHPEVPGVLRGLRGGPAAPHHADGRSGRPTSCTRTSSSSRRRSPWGA